MSDEVERVVWEHLGDCQADIPVQREPIKVRVNFSDHTVSFGGIEISIDALRQIVNGYSENLKAAGKLMEPPF